MNPEWWLNCAEISRLLKWLWDTQGITTRDCIEITETPWSWTQEYEEMCREQVETDGKIQCAEEREAMSEYDDP